jgi:hypothetical protein
MQAVLIEIAGLRSGAPTSSLVRTLSTERCGLHCLSHVASDEPCLEPSTTEIV